MESELRLAVCVSDSWMSIQALRKVGRIQMSRRVCLTLFCLLSVCGKVNNTSTQQKLLRSVPTSCCLQTCRGSIEHPPKTAGLCTPLWGDDGEATPQEYVGVPRHQTNYGQVSGVGDGVAR